MTLDRALLASTLLLAACGGGAGGVDTDGDGLLDREEIDVHGTSPILADTDGDGLDDGVEIVEYGFDPSQDPHKFNPLIADVPELSFELTSMPTFAVLGSRTDGTSTSYGVSEPRWRPSPSPPARPTRIPTPWR